MAIREGRMAGTQLVTPRTDHPQAVLPRHIPGEAGVWLLLFGDTMVFTIFFLIFLYYRGQNAALFVQSQQHLSQTLGLFNTLLMLTSSWLVASGIRAARADKGRHAALGFSLAFICGAGFGIVKFFEYSAKLHVGITLNTNSFFMCYYMFTGIHMLHVLIGMVLLSFMARYSWAGGITPEKISYLEIGASFWHLVDLLWIVLFALLYLVK